MFRLLSLFACLFLSQSLPACLKRPRMEQAGADKLSQDGSDDVTDETSSGNGWQSLPKILAAFAAVITAVSGLVVAMHQRADSPVVGSADVSAGTSISAPADGFSLSGRWRSDHDDCPIQFFLDDGHRVEGSCERGGYFHSITGSYEGSAKKTVTLRIVRRDPAGCETSVHGRIEILDEDHITFWQEGWNGCGAKTDGVYQNWERV